MRSRIGLASLCLVVSAVGCAGGPKPTPVEGVVKLRGKPAGNLLIQFTPVRGQGDAAVVSATAVSDASGRFVLKCDDGRPGAPAGKHKVLVIDNDLSQEGEPQPGARPKRSRVPADYSSATTTPLEVVVEANKKEYAIDIPPVR